MFNITPEKKFASKEKLRFLQNRSFFLKFIFKNNQIISQDPLTFCKFSVSVFVFLSLV